MQKVERPAAEKRKIHSANEFELCYIRHQYFRRVDYNPTAEEMSPYKKITQYLSKRTFYTYPSLFHTIGMTMEDVEAIASIQIVNFLGLFEIGPAKNEEKYQVFITLFKKIKRNDPRPEDILSKNKANFTLFLKQRMDDLVRICKQKAKNIRGVRVDEYIPFYGPVEPPEDLYKLLEDAELYGFKRIDIVQFKAIKKKARAKVGQVFEFAGSYYVSVPLDQRYVTIGDLEGAGMDPRDSLHNLTPEDILSRRETEIGFDKRLKRYKNSSKEEKVQTILAFVESNKGNPQFEDEIVTARKLLRRLGYSKDAR